MFRVRFHLGAGPNFRKWQVTDLESRRVTYHDPESVTLRLTGCRLRNRKSTAVKIHAGSSKTVCAWIDCDSVEATPSQGSADWPRISYNPRVAPFWQDDLGNDVDGARYESITTIGRAAYDSQGASWT